MKVFPNRPTVYFDVDKTLVFSTTVDGVDEYHIKNGMKIAINGHEWLVHIEHVNLLKDFAARGHTIIVWSAGGSDWARMVCEALGIEGLVDACMPKPFWYIDDKKSEEFMDPYRHSYIPLEKP